MSLFMEEAIALAKAAASEDEVPVGAVIVKDDTIIATGYNLREQSRCATKHAEIIAIEAACKVLESWRLTECHLYVTLEPCIMCAGAILQSRIPRVTFGAPDPKGGAMGSLYELHADKRLNHMVTVSEGLLAGESSLLLKDFFRRKRESLKSIKNT